MKYAVVYSSNTGNTEMLAKRIKEIIPANDLTYFGKADKAAEEADIIFVGSWTDKGNCSEDIIEFLNNLSGKKVFIFATAGFGASQSYFEQLKSRMASNLPDDNQVIGSFLCQGKMPMSVRTRYESLAKSKPDMANQMLENFDKALSHPDENDLLNLESEVKKVL